MIGEDPARRIACVKYESPDFDIAVVITNIIFQVSVNLVEDHS